MSLTVKKIIRALGSRIARNIYLWLVILYFVFNNDTEKRAYPGQVYTIPILITTLLIFLITYFNNLFLVPKLLAQKKRKVYFIVAAIAAVAFSFLYAITLKIIITKYPLIEVHQVSLISTPITTEWTLFRVWDESQTFLFGLLLWLCVMTMAWYLNDYSRQQKLVEEVQKKQVESELHFLRTQINPHFLFNTLNNLYGLAIKKSDKGPDAILRLSSILRYILYNSNAELASFEKEKEIMQAYIDLELLRLPENKDFRFNITADREYNIPPLLWLPLLENVFKHATRIISDNYYINYSFTIEDGVMNIYSKNNYKSAVNGEPVDKNGGIGLSNLRKRLALLYPGKHSIETEKDDQYYTVKVQLSLS